jgi:hypothetical protein
VDTRNGTFNITGNLGYLIENGMVTNKPVKDVNITGKLGDIPAMIGGLGNVASMHHTFTGFCGKNNQWVPVDGGGPLMFLKETQVGGGSYRSWTQIVEEYAHQLEEVQTRKRATHQVVIPEIEEFRKPDEPAMQICLVTEVLPFDLFRRVITGEKTYPTHEFVWNEKEERHQLTERRDRHVL